MTQYVKEFDELVTQRLDYIALIRGGDELVCDAYEERQFKRKQVPIIEQAIKEAKDNNQKLIAYRSALAKYKLDKVSYDRLKLEYERDLAYYEANKGSAGFLKEDIEQTLILEKEPSAIIRGVFGGKIITLQEAKEAISSLGTAFVKDVSDKIQSGLIPVKASKDEVITVLYEELQNSSMKSQKIDGLIFTYKPDKDTIFLIEKDPTRTFWYYDFHNDISVDVTVELLDKNKKAISANGALISLSSLNRGRGNIEKVESFHGEYIEIYDSSISQIGTEAYSKDNNELTMYGSKYDSTLWDVNGSNLEYYGAIVGKVSGDTIRLTVGSEHRGVVWMAINSSVKAILRPSPPIEPTEPLKPIFKPAVVVYHEPYLKCNVCYDGGSPQLVRYHSKELDSIMSHPLVTESKDCQWVYYDEGFKPQEVVKQIQKALELFEQYAGIDESKLMIPPINTVYCKCCVDCDCKPFEVGWDMCERLNGEVNALKNMRSGVASTKFCDIPTMAWQILFRIHCMIAKIISAVCWLTDKLAELWDKAECQQDRIKQIEAFYDIEHADCEMREDKQSVESISSLDSVSVRRGG